MKPVSSLRRHVKRVAFAALVATSFAGVARADETCNSPYMSGLIKGQEDYVHVWTLGVAGMGDGFDKLVTTAMTEPDAAKRKATYGQINDFLLDVAYLHVLSNFPDIIAMKANVMDLKYEQSSTVALRNVWLA